jgi:hypothetical protein
MISLAAPEDSDFDLPSIGLTVNDLLDVLTRSVVHRLHEARTGLDGPGAAFARSTPRVIASPEARSRSGCAVMLHAAFGAAAAGARQMGCR